jgi:hypothetical protein
VFGFQLEFRFDWVDTRLLYNGHQTMSSRLNFKLPRNLTSKKVVYLILVVVGIGLAWSWNWYNQQPSVGVIKPAITPPGEVKSDTVSAPARYRSQHISFAYPAVYTDNLNTAPSGRIIEQYSMTAHLEKTESRRVAIMVKSADLTSDMKEDSAYQFRINQKVDYELSQQTTSSGLQVDKFVKKDGGEVTYFINGNLKYVIISSTSTVANGKYLDDVKDIIESFAWD